jgi:hypothetical protein
MKKYRKKPVVIEAAQWVGDTLSEALDFCRENGLPSFEICERTGKGGLIIPTLEGDHIARKEDYIIKGVKGELYPCKLDIFEATYEPVGGEMTIKEIFKSERCAPGYAITTDSHNQSIRWLEVEVEAKIKELEGLLRLTLVPITYAYAHGLVGAEELGRKIEAALLIKEEK